MTAVNAPTSRLTVYPHMTETPESRRLKLHSDPRIPSIGIRADRNLSLANQFKAFVGSLRPIKTTDTSGNVHEIFISTKSLAKHTGLSGIFSSQAPLSKKALERVCQIAAIVSQNTQNLSPEETASLFKKTVCTNSKELEQDTPLVECENICLAEAKDRVHLICLKTLISPSSGVNSGNDIWTAQDVLCPSKRFVFKHMKDFQARWQAESIFNKAKSFNPKGQIRGIQLPPHKVLELTPSQTGLKRVGVLTTEYSSNLKGFAFKNHGQTREAFAQITSGMKYLHEIRRAFHRDIKPSNFLYLASSEISLERFDIADLDDAGDSKQIAKILQEHKKQDSPSSFETAENIWGVATDLFVYGRDEDGVSSLVRAFDRGHLSLQKASQKILKLLQSRDIYALGISFQELVGCSPEKGSYTRPSVEDYCNKLIEKGFSETEATRISHAVDKMLCQEESTYDEETDSFDHFDVRVHKRLEGLKELHTLLNEPGC